MLPKHEAWLLSTWPVIGCYEKWRKPCCKNEREVNTMLDLESHPQNQKWEQMEFPAHSVYSSCLTWWLSIATAVYRTERTVSLQLTHSVMDDPTNATRPWTLNTVHSHSVPCCRAFARNLHSWNIRNSIRCPQGVQLPSAATHPWRLAVTVLQDLFIELVVSIHFNHDLTKEIAHNGWQIMGVRRTQVWYHQVCVAIYIWTSKHVRNLHYQLGFQAFLRSSGYSFSVEPAPKGLSRNYSTKLVGPNHGAPNISLMGKSLKSTDSSGKSL